MNRETPRVDEDALNALARVESPDELTELLASLPVEAAALAVRRAPELERKTEILWALEDRQRRQVLEQLPTTLIAALVQNLEDDNRYLLGDLSAERFDELLSLCSPERRYYWLSTAVSFTDARANVLPLLQDPKELAEALLTRPEFEVHVRAVADHPIERERVPPDLMDDPLAALVELVGAEHLLRSFPIREPRLERLLQNILDFDPDRYVNLVREALAQSDYAENHPEEWEDLTERPVMTPLLNPADSLGEPCATFEPAPEGVESDLALVPLDGGALARLVSALPATEREAVLASFQALCLRQAIAEGGSMDLVDLRRIACGQQAQVLLGLEVAASGARERPEHLRRYRLDRLARAGAAVLENLRQVALRLRPAESVMTPEQRAFVRSLLPPSPGLDEAGGPALRVKNEGGDEWVNVAEAAARLRKVSAWVTMARLLGFARVEAALARPHSVPALQEDIALSALLYGAPSTDPPEPDDVSQFVRRYLSPVARELLPGASPRLRESLREWASRQGGDPDLLEDVLDSALLRLAARLA